MKIFLRGLSCFLISFLIVSCSHEKPRYEQLLGTICSINLFDDGSDELYNKVFARLREIDDEFALDKKHSDLYRINSRAYVEPVTVGEDVFSVMEFALLLSKITDGAFDVSVEPLVKLWNINSAAPHVASKEELDEVLPLIDYRNIVINRENRSVHFLKEGMGLDFGGIAKGFAADEVIKICEENEVRRAIIDLGGNIYVYGKKSNSKDWNVGIKNPEYPDSAPLIRVTVPQNSVVTSGIYERYFEAGEKRYHHIFSPFTGCPVENELSSVTIICKNSMLSDGLSTAFFVLGERKSLELIPKLSSVFNLKISAIFITNNREVKFSRRFPYTRSILYDEWKIKKLYE
ncbi:FAD:protein FMN transferase [Treponema ruminis]|uniref:FAD:protein FMN transferase n=1 Tax=Treponema ruminis TaxID=744515 RepID=A0A7W8G6E0_9SPIR|nr:FAD:protein FMN transferase [Treponema ruminis]MBB5224683.1 thiamine biosynthesis lipoprotein [Treponema ruminis]